MKKKKKVILAMMCLVAVVVLACAFFTFRAHFSTANLPAVEREEIRHLEFGSYPQSLVDDDSLISKLNELPLQWTTYRYYTNRNGQIEQSDYMKYADLDYNGARYRAVTLSEYRPLYLHAETDGGTWQSLKYKLNTVYWFKYEPIKWIVLGGSARILMSEALLDSQPINSVVFYDKSKGAYYKDEEHTVYGTDYAESELRSWLNTTFLETAFTKDEIEKICLTNLNNDAWSKSYAKFDSAPTTDRVFLLSYAEMLNNEYGFSPHSEENDPLRIAYPTDYAMMQGAWAFQDALSDSASWWWLRTGGTKSEFLCACNIYGQVCYAFSISYAPDYIDTAIRPAIALKDGNATIDLG